MCKGRQQYVAMVEGFIDGVFFRNQLKRMDVAEKVARATPQAVLTDLRTFESRTWRAGAWVHPLDGTAQRSVGPERLDAAPVL